LTPTGPVVHQSVPNEDRISFVEPLIDHIRPEQDLVRTRQTGRVLNAQQKVRLINERSVVGRDGLIRQRVRDIGSRVTVVPLSQRIQVVVARVRTRIGPVVGDSTNDGRFNNAA